jgi:hypothetical protein
MRRVKHWLWTALALAFLAASWFWDILTPLIQGVVDLIPLEGLKRAVANFMARLPPYPTLIVFLVPLVVLEPGKLVAFWLFAHRQWMLGVATYVGTDVAKLAVVSFLFKTNRDKLLSIAWFAWVYERIMAAEHWARAQIEPLKAAIRAALEEAGLLKTRGAAWRKVVALWRHARRGGFSRV